MKKTVLLILSIIFMAISNGGAPLILRVYYIDGGKSVWLSTFLQSCAFPVTLIALLISYFCRRITEGPNTKPIFMKVPMLVASIFLGLFVGLCNFCYASGLDLLPVSTVTLIFATQLAFTALFAFLIVKQKFTVFSVAAVVFLVAGAASLAIDAGTDTPQDETVKKYIIGFVLTVVSAASAGLCLPLMQLVYMKAEQEMSYTLVMEMQTMFLFFATIVATIAMLVKHGFKAIPLEAANFELGEAKYYLVIVSIAIACQIGFLGSVGVIFSGSALLCGIVLAVLVPVSEILAVIFLHEKFTVGKGISLGLCLLGFASYYYGEIEQSKKSDSTNEDASQMLLHDNVLPN